MELHVAEIMNIFLDVVMQHVRFIKISYLNFVSLIIGFSGFMVDHIKMAKMLFMVPENAPAFSLPMSVLMLAFAGEM